MNFNFILSLKEMTRRRIAASLYNHDDIVTLINECPYYYYGENIENATILYDRIIGKLEKLLLPTALEDALRNTIRSVGLEILKFNCFQEKYLGVKNHFFDSEIKIYWTYLGTIDKIRTAMSFVKDNKIDFTLRYKIACIYCLEDGIRILREKMAQDNKKILIKTDFLPIYRGLIYFWETEMKKELFKLNELRRSNQNVYVGAFQHSARNGNAAATRYFFQKLSDEEKREEGLKITQHILTVVDFSKMYHIHSEVLQFLLLNISKKDILKVFKTCSYNLLCSFLDWPLQPYINDLAGLVWDYINPSHFAELLYVITERNGKLKGCYGYDYASLFNGLWSNSPLHFKKFIISVKAWQRLLCKLYLTGDTNSVNLMLKMLAPEQVESFITGSYVLSLILELLASKEFNVIEACLEACVTSEKIGETLKKNFEMHISSLWIKEKCWETFFTLLDAKISALAAKRENEDRETL